MAIRYEPLDGGMAVAVDDFCGFGADALFLARFASPRPGERVVDLGTGCGILPVLLLRDSAAAHVTGVEIQPAAAALARRSVARSGLDGRAAVLCASWTDLDGLLPREGFHLVVCNPPYFPPGSGRESASPAARLARHLRHGARSAEHGGDAIFSAVAPAVTRIFCPARFQKPRRHGELERRC